MNRPQRASAVMCLMARCGTERVLRAPWITRRPQCSAQTMKLSRKSGCRERTKSKEPETERRFRRRRLCRQGTGGRLWWIGAGSARQTSRRRSAERCSRRRRTCHIAPAVNKFRILSRSFRRFTKAIAPNNNFQTTTWNSGMRAHSIKRIEGRTR